MIHTLSTFAGAAGSYLKARLSRAVVPFDEAQRQFERGYLVRLLALTRGDVVAAVRISRLNWQELHDLFERHRLDPAHFRERDPEAFAILDSGFSAALHAGMYSLPL